MKGGEQDYLFEQFRVERGCLGYLVTDPATKVASFGGFQVFADACNLSPDTSKERSDA